MAQQNINVGTSANDGTGDTLRDSQIKANGNFTELYTNKVDKISGKGLSSNDYTDTEQTKLAGIEAGAQVNVQADFAQTDDTQDDYIKNKPDSLYASIGYFQHNDLATQTTPISVTASTETKLTNDALGPFTNLSQAPYGVSNDWDSVTNSFDFSELSVGDTLDLRVDLSLTTTTANTSFTVILRVGEGSLYEYDIIVFTGSKKLSTADFQEVGEVGFSLDYAEHLTNPASLYIIADEDMSVKVKGWYTRIVLKDVNIVSFSDPTKKVKVESNKYNDLLLTGTDALIQLRPDGSSYYELSNAGLVSVKGFDDSLILDTNPEYPYEGKDFVIKNSTGNSITLKENVITGVRFPFRLKDGVDAVLLNGDSMWFKSVNGVVEFEEIIRTATAGGGGNLKIISITGNTTLSATHKDAVLIIKANATLTIPSGLGIYFNFVVGNLESVTCNVVAGAGVTITPSTVSVTDRATLSVIADGTDNYQIFGL